MTLTMNKLMDLVRRLEDATRGESKHACPVQRVNPDGTTERVEQPNLQKGPRKPITVPNGPHGKAFLGINPETGEVSCAECERSKT